MSIITNDKSMVVHSPESLDDYFKVNGCSLVIREGISFEIWQEKFVTMRQMNGYILWWLGDMIIYAEKNYGERCYQAFEDYDFDIETLKAAAWVASKFDPVRRRTDLSWSHHKDLASLQAEDSDKWLQIAATEKWSTRDLRKAIKQPKDNNLEGPSLQLLTLYISFKEEHERIFNMLPVSKWDPALFDKMKDTFYGSIMEIEEMTGWIRRDTRFKSKKNFNAAKS